jgi:D-alanyl-D-alanine carboxypeptidase
MALLLVTVCTRPQSSVIREETTVQAAVDQNNKTDYNDRLQAVLRSAEIPQNMAAVILNSESAFLPDLSVVLESSDPYLRLLVDKQDPLVPQNYIPSDLVELTDEGAFLIGRTGLLLRYPAAVALEEMAEAAQEKGINLVASSTYRSYDYQIEVYNRNVRQSGQAVADRESARPGYSQHQLGLVVDFGSISDDYAKTPAGRWLAENAGHYGWSLSFPDGYEDITGYRWECWHYRYVGKKLARFIDIWFGGIQQYALRFIHEWELFD